MSAEGETTSSSLCVAPSVDNDTVLEDIVESQRSVEISPKRGGDPVEEEVQSPSNALKIPRLWVIGCLLQPHPAQKYYSWQDGVGVCCFRFWSL